MRSHTNTHTYTHTCVIYNSLQSIRIAFYAHKFAILQVCFGKVYSEQQQQIFRFYQMDKCICGTTWEKRFVLCNLSLSQWAIVCPNFKYTPPRTLEWLKTEPTHWKLMFKFHWIPIQLIAKWINFNIHQFLNTISYASKKRKIW